MTGSGERLSRWTRLLLAGMGLGVISVLSIAIWLQPDPRGYGTHTQLGLPPCSFRVLTRYPCPACGMTTAFAWSVRGRVDKALVTNPAGAILVPLCLVSLPWLLGAAFTGRPWPFRSIDQPLALMSLGVVGVALVSWAIRVFWTFRSSS